MIRTPLARRTLREVAVGRSGSPDTRLVCASGQRLDTVAFSPDGLTLAVVAGGETELLDLVDPGRALAPLVRGRVLDWQA